MKKNSLLTEVLVIGLVVGLIGVPVSYIAMYLERKDIKLPLKSWVRIFLTFTVTGILVHLLFEWTGMNKKYCKTGYACQ